MPSMDLQPRPQGRSSGPPTGEIGQPTEMASLLPWSSFIDYVEYVPELTWPASIWVYERMLTDAQVSGLFRGVTMPIRKYQWMIDANGARPEAVQGLAADLNLPIKGTEVTTVPRRRGRFIHDAHLALALKALAYGHYFFETVGEIRDGLWHLKKLGPRPPRTIGEIDTEPDGGLVQIKQLYGNPAPVIPANRLVAYVWDQDPGIWTGRSMLRAMYRNWLIKDRLLRVDAIKHERTGVGTPVAEAPPGASDEEIKKIGAMMRSLKVSEGGGGAVPSGTKAQLMGTTGSIPDTIASIRFHNEEMARSFLMMFMQLGQTETGSRALGREFIDFFGPIQTAIADWYCDITNEHVAEDWMDYNFGEDEPAPLVVYQKVEDENLEVAELVSLVQSGAIVMDEELEAAIRDKYKLPPPDPSTSVTVPRNSPPTDPAQARRNARRARGDAPPSSIPLPPRALRREPYDHEIRATTDFATIDAQLTGTIDSLVNTVKMLQQTQIQQLHDQIVNAGGNVKKLAKLAADPVHEESLYTAMAQMADMGIDQAAKEAARQGVSQPKSASLADVESLLGNQAQAVDQLLASSISDAAVRQALRRSAKSVSAQSVADEVAEHLRGLKGTFLKDQMNGALNMAMNTGRKAVMNRNNPQNIYASELLDEATCEYCIDVDGTEYTSMLDAESDYPTGGYTDCAGMERCRGTLVAVYEEAS